jgi:hypothetical protein
MRKIILIFTLFILKTTKSCGQAINPINESALFLEGIYLENLNTILPWEINFKQIEKYGNPSITKDSNHSNQILIKWDSVKILNNVMVNLYINQPKKFLNQNAYKRIKVFNAYIDSISEQKLISFFTKYTNDNGYQIKKRKVVKRQWIFNNCRVFVGIGKFYGYFLSIEKMN